MIAGVCRDVHYSLLSYEDRRGDWLKFCYISYGPIEGTYMPPAPSDAKGGVESVLLEICKIPSRDIGDHYGCTT